MFVVAVVFAVVVVAVVVVVVVVFFFGCLRMLARAGNLFVFFLKTIKITQNWTGVIELPMWGRITQCNCMVILRDFP